MRSATLSFRISGSGFVAMASWYANAAGRARWDAGVP
jgi:hypothetical protein